MPSPGWPTIWPTKGTPIPAKKPPIRRPPPKPSASLPWAAQTGGKQEEREYRDGRQGSEEGHAQTKMASMKNTAKSYGGGPEAGPAEGHGGAEAQIVGAAEDEERRGRRPHRVLTGS
jgi:hypothetical protein